MQGFFQDFICTHYRLLERIFIVSVESVIAVCQDQIFGFLQARVRLYKEITWSCIQGNLFQGWRLSVFPIWPIVNPVVYDRSSQLSDDHDRQNGVQHGILWRMT